jgi:hypothetical protein
MDRAELQSRLQELGVREDAYSLDGPRDESYCLSREGVAWSVYYSERGLTTGRREFDAEHDACRYLLDRLLADPLTRR